MNSNRSVSKSRWLSESSFLFALWSLNNHQLPTGSVFIVTSERYLKLLHSLRLFRCISTLNSTLTLAASSLHIIPTRRIGSGFMTNLPRADVRATAQLAIWRQLYDAGWRRSLGFLELLGKTNYDPEVLNNFHKSGVRWMDAVCLRWARSPLGSGVTGLLHIHI